jgi:hypothetical protein
MLTTTAPSPKLTIRTFGFETHFYQKDKILNKKLSNK